jgi:hypothetical protein
VKVIPKYHLVEHLRPLDPVLLARYASGASQRRWHEAQRAALEVALALDSAVPMLPVRPRPGCRVCAAMRLDG